MGVSRLSEIDPTPNDQPKEPMERPGTMDEAKLDAVIERAMEHIPSAYPDEDEAPAPKSKKSLDDLIESGIDKYESGLAERESFSKSSDSRAELNHYYGAQGNIGETIDKFIQWAAHFRENPQEAGLSFAESFIRAGSQYALKDFQPKPKVEASIDGTGRRESGRKLDSILEGAIDGNDQQDFVATEKQRAELKKLMPGKSFDEALATIVKINRDGFADPLATAATVAASFGLPITPRQREHAQRLGQIANQIEQVAPQLGIRTMDDVARVNEILAMPEFQRTGDHVQDLARAQRIVQIQAQNTHNDALYLDQQLRSLSPDFAAAVEHVIKHDEAFKQQVARNNAGRFGDPGLIAENFQAALAWARVKQHSVAKARRAAPVRSSGGALAPALGGGLDSHLSRALKNYEG